MDTKSKLEILELGREMYFAAIKSIAFEPVTDRHRNYDILHAEYDQMQLTIHALKRWSEAYEAQFENRHTPIK
jgi:hypothetical protein